MSEPTPHTSPLALWRAIQRLNSQLAGLVLSTGTTNLSTGTTNEDLLVWVAAEAYPSFTPVRDSADVITTATLTWPDGSAGVFTTTVKNNTFSAIDAFTVTHAASGRTVTQPTMTRDSIGNVTVRPALTVTP